MYLNFLYMCLEGVICRFGALVIRAEQREVGEGRSGEGRERKVDVISSFSEGKGDLQRCYSSKYCAHC